MSITSGFFNSLNGDRKYNAEQMSALFNGLINDGIFATIGDAFNVKAYSGNQITVGTGRAWFDNIWIDNDALLPINMPDAEVLLPRWDAVVIDVDKSEPVRTANVVVLKGVAATEPKHPTLINNDYHTQYVLAIIYRAAGSTSISQSEITSYIGRNSTPYVTGLLQVVNVDSHVAQWYAEFDEWMRANRTTMTNHEAEFLEWFESIQNTLEGDVAANLAAQIMALKSTMITATLSANVWSGTEAPYTYQLTIAGVTATSAQEWLLPTNATMEQVEAAQAANILDGGQSANTVILKAWGDKPEIDIPVRIIKRGDL